MAVEIEPNIEHAALFDRTAEQRQRHTELVLEMRANYPDIGITVVSHLADLRMERDFYEWLDREADTRAGLYGASDSQPFTEEFDQQREIAMAVIRDEIQELHESLGFPMLELRGPKADV